MHFLEVIATFCISLVGPNLKNSNQLDSFEHLKHFLSINFLDRMYLFKVNGTFSISVISPNLKRIAKTEIFEKF